MVPKTFFHVQVQERFEVDIKELPEQIDTSTYSKLNNLFTVLSFWQSFPFSFSVILMFLWREVIGIWILDLWAYSLLAKNIGLYLLAL